MIRVHSLTLPEAREGLPGVLRLAGLPPAPEAHTPWPDIRVGWLIPALSAALRVLARESPSAIYSTHPPATAHLVALILHRISGLPWVADFRDGWTLDPLFCADGARQPAFTTARNELEATMTDEATFVTVADDSIDLRGLARDSTRRITIANGVDPEDFIDARPSDPAPPDPAHFRLSHVGTLDHARDGGGLFRALRLGLDSGLIDADKLELRLVGWSTLRAEIPSDLPITATGYVNHAASIAEMRSASALLFYEEADTKHATGKIYEYLAAGRPILCAASPDNLGACLVRELGAGVCVDIRDPAAIAEAIAQMQRTWALGSLRISRSVRDQALRRFSRRDRSAELADVLRRAQDGLTTT